MHDSNSPPPRHEEVVFCEASREQGLAFIKVVALPHQDPVEFDTAQARALAEKLLRAVEEVEAGWAGQK